MSVMFLSVTQFSLKQTDQFIPNLVVAKTFEGIWMILVVVKNDWLGGENKNVSSSLKDIFGMRQNAFGLIICPITINCTKLKC